MRDCLRWAAQASPDVSLLSFYSVHRVPAFESYGEYVARQGLEEDLLYAEEFAEGTVRATPASASPVGS